MKAKEKVKLVMMDGGGGEMVWVEGMEKGKLVKGEMLEDGVWLGVERDGKVGCGEEGVCGWVKKYGRVNVEYMGEIRERRGEDLVRGVEGGM